MLQPSIPLPRVEDSDQPRLVYGFVILARAFRQIDQQFLTVWKNKPMSHLENSQDQDSIQALNELLQNHNLNGGEESGANPEIDQTQYLDISVTIKWLPLLAWQMKNGRRLTSTTTAYPVTTSERPPPYYPSFPFKMSQELLNIIGIANRRALESHGIGMVSHVTTLDFQGSDQRQRGTLLTSEARRNKKSSILLAVCRMFSNRHKWVETFS